MIRYGTQDFLVAATAGLLTIFSCHTLTKKADTSRKKGKGKQSGKERSAVVVTT